MAQNSGDQRHPLAALFDDDDMDLEYEPSTETSEVNEEYVEDDDDDDDDEEEGDDDDESEYQGIDNYPPEKCAMS